METIKELFRIGVGPSSSHTMAPRFAAERFTKEHPGAKAFKVTLYGSLAATGRGHLTDVAIKEALRPKPTKIIWRKSKVLPRHPNGMRFEALDGKNQVIGSKKFYSLGGGALEEEGRKSTKKKIYNLTKMTDIMKKCQKDGLTYWKYVEDCEGKNIWKFLEKVWKAMGDAIDRGLETEGVLPGGLNVPRKANLFSVRATKLREAFARSGYIWGYAYASAEENAAGGEIVTAPTCGSCGVVPAVLRYVADEMQLKTPKILQALATAGLIGNIIKTNASISGAEVGCQGEIGSACAMAAGAAAQMLGGSVQQIEYAAEMGLEHHLGLTCDPIEGLVQIPCIERNAHAATRALSCALMASVFSDGIHLIPFDAVVKVMKETGKDLPEPYRETSKGGLTKIWNKKKGRARTD